MRQESQRCHSITPLHEELRAQGRAETTLDREWESLFLSRLGNCMAVTIRESCRLYRPWFPFGSVERLGQKNFSLKLLRPCSHTFSRPPVARAQAITAHVTLPHQAPSAWAEQALGSLVISPVLCSSAHMGCEALPPLTPSCRPCRLNTSLPRNECSVIISVFPNFTILLDRYCLMCLHKTS